MITWDPCTTIVTSMHHRHRRITSSWAHPDRNANGSCVKNRNGGSVCQFWVLRVPELGTVCWILFWHSGFLRARRELLVSSDHLDATGPVQRRWSWSRCCIAIDLKAKPVLKNPGEIFKEQLEGCVKSRNGASVNIADDTADDSETAACTKA